MRRLVFTIAACMFLSHTIQAQLPRVKSIKWEIGGEIPALEGATKSRGLAGAASGIHNQRLIVAGGCNFPDSMPWQGGKKVYYDNVFVFKKKGGRLLDEGKYFNLPFPLAYAAVCSTSQGIICAGGENSGGISARVLLIRWDEKAKIPLITFLPSLPFSLTNASIISSGQTVYLAGGEMKNGVSDRFMKLDLADTSRGWESLPSLPRPLSHMVLSVTNKDGKEYICLAGGRKKNPDAISDFSDALYQYDIESKLWNLKTTLPFAVSAGTGVVVGSRYFLMIGGDKGETFHETERLLLAINDEKNESRKSDLIRRKNEVQSAHPGFSKEVWLYDAVEDSWNCLGCIPFDAPVTTTVVLMENYIVIPGGEIRAGVRTPHILTGKISFK